jgi:hypothetical protein
MRFFYVCVKLDAGQFIASLFIIKCVFPEQHLQLSALIVTNRVQASEQMLTTVVALAATRRMNLSNNNSIVRASPLHRPVVVLLDREMTLPLLLLLFRLQIFYFIVGRF